jgi:hypothetical protein
MTSLTLNKLWINRLDTGEAISAPTERGSRSQKWTNGLEVRQYANGRNRSIGTTGEQGAISYKLLLISQATYEQLRTWKGIAVQVRDHRGQKWFGVFGEVDVDEYLPSGLYSATVTLLVITATEGV